VFLAFIVTGVGIAAALVTQFEQRGLVNESGGFDSRADLDRLFELDDRVQTLNDVFLALMIITAIAFINWMWRAAKNNQALGRPNPRLGPGWAIGGWLIPLANFVIPVLVLQDIWRGSNASIPRGDMRWKIADRSALVGWWWAALLFGRVLIAAGGGQLEEGGDNIRRGIDTQIVGNVCSLAAVVLAILLVRRITERQEECLRAQSGVVPPPPAPGS
jgi:hypothetical protein